MIKYILTVITLLLSILVMGQSTSSVTTINNAVSGNSSLDYLLGGIDGRNSKLNKTLIGLQGSAYTADDYRYTTIYYEDEPQGNVYYRYNAYGQEIEIKTVNTVDAPLRSLEKDKKISIIVDGKPMSFKTFIDKKNETTNGYLIQLSEGKHNLYKRIFVKYTEGQKAQNSFVRAIPARFTQFVEYYYFKEGSKRMDEIELKNKKLLKLVPEAEKAGLKAFLKENSLNIKNPADLDKAFIFLNKK